jgi:hypothetical protein
MAKLAKTDLWTLYNVSNELRDYVARPLFSQTKLSFESFLPFEINGRMLPAKSIFEILRVRSFSIRELRISLNNQKIRAAIWDLVGKMSHLTVCW